MKRTLLLTILGATLLAAAPPAGRPIRVTCRTLTTTALSFPAAGKQHLAFELLLTNYEAVPTRIDWLEIQGGSFRQKFEGESLKALFSGAQGNYAAPQDPVMAAGGSGILFVFLDLPADQLVPGQLTSTLSLTNEKIAGQTLATSIAVRSNAYQTVTPPLRGSNWVAANGPSPASVHRRATLVIDGKMSFTERFAIDWVQIGNDGSTSKGDRSKNESYHAYRAEILAAADGVITAAVDGIPDNVPQQPPIQAITLQNIAGNHLIQDFGDGRYALYAHIIPGTLRVKAGDRVKRGQVLGLLGNSGNSSEPHLHFHVMDGTDPLGSDGVPQVFTNWIRHPYTLQCPSGQTCELMGEPVTLKRGTVQKVARDGALENELQEFPQ